MSHTWSPTDYQLHAGFVPVLGASILARLSPQAGERILDLGCGDGVLTQDLVASGADVVAVDASPQMVAAAVSRGLAAREMDGRALTFTAEFDAVFSNAVLHWIPEADAVLAGVARALEPGGRFVAEFGGHGNVAAIVVALRAAFARHGLVFRSPWYYPSPEEYGARLDANGFSVDDIRLVPRPTPLPTGMLGWLRTFGVSIFSTVPEPLVERVEQDVLELLRPALCEASGRWTADYVRLQVVARLRS